MESFGGGTIHFVGIASVDTRATECVCLTRGVVEVLWGDKLMETFATRPGDVLLVRDGATVTAGARLFERDMWLDRVHAPLPADAVGLARWSEATVALCDEVTGLTRPAFAAVPRSDIPAPDVRLDVVDERGGVLWTCFVPRRAYPAVADNDRVARGDLVARVPRVERPDEFLGGVERLRSFLQAQLGWRGGVAAIAPCDGRVENVAAGCIVLAHGDARVTVRVRKGAMMNVRAGDGVRAGDALTAGERSHHALLRAWGEERLARHLLDELVRESARRGARIAPAYWSIAIRSMLAWRRVLTPGDTGLRRHQVLSKRAWERVQRETLARGGALATAAPVLRALVACDHRGHRVGSRADTFDG